MPGGEDLCIEELASNLSTYKDKLHQVISLTEELLATAKPNEEYGLASQPDADVSPSRGGVNGGTCPPGLAQKVLLALNLCTHSPSSPPHKAQFLSPNLPLSVPVILREPKMEGKAKDRSGKSGSCSENFPPALKILIKKEKEGVPSEKMEPESEKMGSKNPTSSSAPSNVNPLMGPDKALVPAGGLQAGRDGYIRRLSHERHPL